MVGNKFFDSLPRMIVYPIVKYLLYFEYQIQKLFARNRSNNLFVYTKKVKRLPKENPNTKSTRKRSLRGYVMQNRKPPKDDVEKVRELLTAGL